MDSNGTVRQEGEEWECEDGCNTCFCMEGSVAQTLLFCTTATTPLGSYSNFPVTLLAGDQLYEL